MARSSQPDSRPLAAAALAGAATLIFQGAVEQQHNAERDFVYRDLFRGAQLIVIFLLVVLSILAPHNTLANITALAAAVVLRYVDLLSTTAEFAAVAGACVILAEALAMSLT